MPPSPDASFQSLFTHLIGDMAKAIAERPGENEAQRLIRLNATVRLIVGLAPRDGLEAMLAGHCVLFHALIVDGVKAPLHAETEAVRRSGRSGVVAMNRAFLGNLAELRRCQARPAEGERGVAPAEAASCPDVPAPGPDRPAPRREADAAPFVGASAGASVCEPSFPAGIVPLPPLRAPALTSTLAAQAALRAGEDGRFRLSVPGSRGPAAVSGGGSMAAAARGK